MLYNSVTIVCNIVSLERTNLAENETTIEQLILCLNITVDLRCRSHNQPLPYNELNTMAVLLGGPVVATRVYKTYFLFSSETARPNHKVRRCGPGDSMSACHAAGPGSIPGRDKFGG